MSLESHFQLTHADNGTTEDSARNACGRALTNTELSEYLQAWRDVIRTGVHHQARQRRQEVNTLPTFSVGAGTLARPSTANVVGSAKGASASNAQGVKRPVQQSSYRSDFALHEELRAIASRFNDLHRHSAVRESENHTPRVPFVMPGLSTAMTTEVSEQFRGQQPKPPQTGTLPPTHWMSGPRRLAHRKEKAAPEPEPYKPPPEKLKKLLEPSERLLRSARNERAALEWQAAHVLAEKKAEAISPRKAHNLGASSKRSEKIVPELPLRVYLPTTSQAFRPHRPQTSRPHGQTGPLTVREGYFRELGRKRQFTNNVPAYPIF